MKLYTGVCSIFLFLLVALMASCESNSVSVNAIKQNTLPVLENSYALTNRECDEFHVGEMLYVRDSARVYYCNGSKWSMFNGIDGKDGIDGRDGIDGVDGYNGVNGLDGSSCSITSFADGYMLVCGASSAVIRLNLDLADSCSIAPKGDSAYVLSCGDSSTVLKNGIDGLDGSDCEQIDLGNGVVELVCGSDTLKSVKAMCGDEPYDPSGDKFCYTGSLVERCGGKIYDINKYVCVDGVLMKNCGGVSFDFTEKFCFKNVIYDLCGDSAYNADKNFCFENSVYEKCGGESYDIESKICYLDKVHDFIIDARDGKRYATATIGKQVWLAQNLDYEIEDSYCFNDSASYCEERGRLYDWAGAMKLDKKCDSIHGTNVCVVNDVHQGICPEGFHVPSKVEYETLLTFVRDYARTKNVSSTFLLFAAPYWKTLSVERTDALGFGGIPAGGVFTPGPSAYGKPRLNNFICLDYWLDLWSTTERDEKNVYYVTLNDATGSQIITLAKNVYRSLRCIKD